MLVSGSLLFLPCPPSGLLATYLGPDAETVTIRTYGAGSLDWTSCVY